jgi:hypothetical protein
MRRDRRSVVSLVVHPVVGKLVEGGGDALADQFAKLLGDEGSQTVHTSIRQLERL